MGMLDINEIILDLKEYFIDFEQVKDLKKKKVITKYNLQKRMMKEFFYV